MKILLLEDDLILNEILEEHLLSQNYTVKTVFTGLEAQELLYSEKFDLLLFDVNTPLLNGFELLKDLREKEIFKTLDYLKIIRHNVLTFKKDRIDEYLRR